jgi:hypothetical protein
MKRQRLRGGLVGDLAQLDGGIHIQAGDEVVGGEQAGGVGIEPLPKFINAVGRHGYPGCVKVSTEFSEQLGHLLERFEQMESRNATAGALRQAVLGSVSENECRPMEPLYQSRGHDAEDTAMPALAGENERGLVSVMGTREHSSNIDCTIWASVR